MRNEMNMLKLRLPNQIIASITNEATGVAFMTDVIGLKSISTAFIFEDTAARAPPKISAEKNPVRILSDEKPTAQ